MGIAIQTQTQLPSSSHSKYLTLTNMKVIALLLAISAVAVMSQEPVKYKHIHYPTPVNHKKVEKYPEAEVSFNWSVHRQQLPSLLKFQEYFSDS